MRYFSSKFNIVKILTELNIDLKLLRGVYIIF